jgi:hypothetical protein
MPSIFIWKAATSNTSKKMIRIYSGSNWVLEENDNCSNSKSYMYLDQIVISKSDDLLITFHTKNMPQDWVGSDLLEVSYVPYEMIKSDTMGTLEMIGDWMRFTKNAEIEYNLESLKAEHIHIQKWINHTTNKNMNTNTNTNKIHNSKYHKSKANHLDPQKVQLNFQEFLIKYSLPANHSNYVLTART